MADPRLKSLRIKTGVLKRTYKETISYQNEAAKIQEKIKKMQEDGEDVFYVKKQDGLLQETQSVIVDCQRRLNIAYADVSKLVQDETELEEAEEYIAAKAALEEAKALATA
ncbi:tubulin-specific chaperone A-like [Hyalella azteca]|uniref:Tubulin-specific chaperone A n=1 Tax=Hyalella azteca TaxID=294128 RepID=A0A8B7PIP0_HYAAZ|nr:tubulin-specific chaperone A-like [Hyalella azteca]XP_047741034.1 tubulin-specific chaperone A-like [Hyalella azteca]